MSLCPSRRCLTGSNHQGSATWVNTAKENYLTQYPQFASALNANFPGSVSLGELISDFSADIAQYGFENRDAIPMISVCRDEICRPLIDAVEVIWGNSFSLGSLAGMIFAGTTGLAAGMHHAPDVEEVERFIFIVAPHIAISSAGVVGKVVRPGVPNLSSACGALVGFLGELTSGTVNYALSSTDMEYVLMKGQMSTYFQYGSVPSLAGLTQDAQKLIMTQLTSTLAAFNLVGTAAYMVLGGIQIHGPDAATFFQPLNYYFVDTTGAQTQGNIGVFGTGVGAAEYFSQVTTVTNF